MRPKLLSFKTPEFLQGLFGPEINLYSYGVFIALGILAAFYVTLSKSKKLGMDTDKLSGLFLWIILAAFIGGKFFFFLEDAKRYLAEPSLIWRNAGGGFVFYGSLLFAVPTIIWRLRHMKVPVRPFLDVLAFAGPVIHSIGRIGCLMAGCCHGSVCELPIGITFNDPETLADPVGVPLYPTQLFDIGLNLLILLVVWYVEKRKRFEGQLFLIYLMMYGVGRSIVEIFRGDEARGFLFNGLLSHSQFIAILIIIGSVFIWMRWSRSTHNS